MLMIMKKKEEEKEMIMIQKGRAVMTTQSKDLPRAKKSHKHFTCMLSYNPYNNPPEVRTPIILT